MRGGGRRSQEAVLRQDDVAGGGGCRSGGISRCRRRYAPLLFFSLQGGEGDCGPGRLRGGLMRTLAGRGGRGREEDAGPRCSSWSPLPMPARSPRQVRGVAQLLGHPALAPRVHRSGCGRGCLRRQPCRRLVAEEGAASAVNFCVDLGKPGRGWAAWGGGEELRSRGTAALLDGLGHRPKSGGGVEPRVRQCRNADGIVVRIWGLGTERRGRAGGGERGLGIGFKNSK